MIYEDDALRIDYFNEIGGRVVKVFNLGAESEGTYGFKKKQIRYIYGSNN